MRLPKALHLDVSEVTVRRVGNRLILEAVPGDVGWGEFWCQLLPLRERIKRHPTRSAEKRTPL